MRAPIPTAPKHLGISYLLLDMRTKGVEVRPLITASGHAHFNEVFFEDVQVPKENLVGPKNEGWKVAMTTLSYERGAAGGGYDSQIRALVDLAHRHQIDGRPAWEQDWVRQRIAQLAIESKAARYARLRSLTRQLKGLPPGPEGSMLKLFGSELGVRIAIFRLRVAGSVRPTGATDAGAARRATMAEPGNQLAPVHDCGRHQRDSAQHYRRAHAEAAQRIIGPWAKRAGIFAAAQNIL